MITVLFNIDGNFSQHLGVCIASLLVSNPGTPFHLIVASPTALDPHSLAALNTTVTLGNAVLEYVVHDAASHYAHLPVHSHLAPIVYLRLFMTEYVDSSITKLIYLDSDVIVCKDIGALWATDLGDAYAGAAPEPYDEQQRAPLGFARHDFYFNAGVMLVNLTKWRADNVVPKFVDYANANQQLLWSLDQDIMNSVFKGQVLNIGYQWNWQALCPRFTPEELGLTEQVFLQLRASPNIVHYTSHYKPWFYRWEPHYKKLYEDVIKRTPWADYIPPDKCIRNLPVKLAKVMQQKLEWYLPGLARDLRLRIRSRTKAGRV